MSKRIFPDEKVAAICAVFYDGIRRRKEIEIVYKMRDGYKPSAADLASMEVAVSGIAASTLRHLCGLDEAVLPDNFLRLDVARMDHRDDGENSIRIRVDFAAILGELDRRAADQAAEPVG